MSRYPKSNLFGLNVGSTKIKTKLFISSKLDDFVLKSHK